MIVMKTPAMSHELALPITLDELRRVLRKHGAVSASLFGSFARGEAGADSDIDLLVRLDSAHTLFDVVDMQTELEAATGRPVDITTALHPRFEPYITPDMVRVL